MGLEIERKFIVTGDGYKLGATRKLIRQGFLNDDMDRMVRIRLVDNKAFLTVKGPLKDASRSEFEYPIPVAEAEAMLVDLCIPPILEKNRYVVEIEGLTWEVDVFMGVNEGLIVAEVELEESGQKIIFPEWIGKEITDDKRYYNASLVGHPYCNWKNKEKEY